MAFIQRSKLKKHAHAQLTISRFGEALEDEVRAKAALEGLIWRASNRARNVPRRDAIYFPLIEAERSFGRAF